MFVLVNYFSSLKLLKLFLVCRTMIRLFKIKDQKKEDAANANGRAPGKKQSAGELRLHKGLAMLKSVLVYSLYLLSISIFYD